MKTAQWIKDRASKTNSQVSIEDLLGMIITNEKGTGCVEFNVLNTHTILLHEELETIGKLFIEFSKELKGIEKQHKIEILKSKLNKLENE